MNELRLVLQLTGLLTKNNRVDTAVHVLIGALCGLLGLRICARVLCSAHDYNIQKIEPKNTPNPKIWTLGAERTAVYAERVHGCDPDETDFDGTIICRSVTDWFYAFSRAAIATGRWDAAAATAAGRILQEGRPRLTHEHKQWEFIILIRPFICRSTSSYGARPRHHAAISCVADIRARWLLLQRRRHAHSAPSGVDGPWRRYPHGIGHHVRLHAVHRRLRLSVWWGVLHSHRSVNEHVCATRRSPRWTRRMEGRGSYRQAHLQGRQVWL